jgi:hypothetical protein
MNRIADIHILPKVLDAAQRFQQKPSEDEMKALAARVGLEPLFT